MKAPADFLVVRAITGLAEEGDILRWRPHHPKHPVLVLRHHGWSALDLFVTHRHHLEPLDEAPTQKGGAALRLVK